MVALAGSIANPPLDWEKINRKIDYIPLLSTIVNLAKIIFKVVTYVRPSSKTFFQRWCITDIESKSFISCILLLIPGLNFIVAAHLDKTPQKPPSENEEHKRR